MDKKLKLNIFLTAVVLAAFFAFFIPQNSLAWFNDEEMSLLNTLSASTLEFSASPVDDLPLEGIAPYTNYNHRLDLTKIGTLDFNYSITLGNFDDNGSGLCENLTIKDDISGSSPVFIKNYSLNLASFPANSSLNFTIRLVSNAPELQDKTCNFSYKITAWQTDMPDTGTGFSDEKLVNDSILSDPWIVEPAQNKGQDGGENYEEEKTGDIEGSGKDENNEENAEESGEQEQQPGQEEGGGEEEGKIENPEDGNLIEESEASGEIDENENNGCGNNNDTNGETSGGQNENPETE